MPLNSLQDGECFITKVKDGLWAFQSHKSPNNGISWWLECSPEPVLIDCPKATKENIQEIKKLSRGRSSRIILTSRESHDDVINLQSELQWPILVQEQEAYLLPSINNLETFSNEYLTVSGLHLLWTPGPTPGSCVIYAPEPINVLFCGRLLIPVDLKKISSVRNRSTFHWTNQLKSLKRIEKYFSSKRLPLLASSVPVNVDPYVRLFDWEDWIEQ